MDWDPALECGVQEVDNEHKELFHLVESLLNEANEGESAESSAKALEFLGKYVVKHFAHEEALMKKCKYPNTSEHEAAHNKFVRTFLDLKKKFEQTGGSHTTSVEINHAAMSWLVNHIKVIDLQFLEYYKNSNRQNTGSS